jgi:hypothetical protein
MTVDWVNRLTITERADDFAPEVLTGEKWNA